MFTLPISTEGARLLPAGEFSVYGNVVVSSHSFFETFADEALTLDGETTRLEIDFRYALSPRLELGIRVPYVWHEPGALDSLIESWHDTFGLPQSRRDSREKDLLEFSYSDASGQVFDYRSRSDGPGDIRLVAGYRISSSANHVTALRLGIKLPTGDADEFHGSGGTDVSLGIAGDWNSLFGQTKLNGYYRAHVVAIGEPDRLADRYEDLVWQLSTGFGYRVTPAFELRAQVTARTANYDSRIEILGQNSFWLMFGANIDIGKRFRLSLGVAEDIKVRSAPDVTFQVGLRYQPGTAP